MSGMNRQEVLDAIAPALRLRVTEADHRNARIIIDQGEPAIRPGARRPALAFAETGMKALLRHTRLGEGTRDLDEKTFSLAATQLLGKKEFALMVQDNKVVDLVPPGEYRTLNPERVLDNIERGVGEGVEYHRALIPAAQIVQLEVLGIEQKAVVVGDIVRAGATVTFSTLGTPLPIVNAYAQRLWCTNGAISTQSIGEFKYAGGGGEGDSIWQWFRESTRRAVASLGMLTEEWRKLAEASITPEERAMAIEQLIKSMRLNGEEAAAVRNQAMQSPPENQWDVFNLGSHLTSHVIERHDRIVGARTRLATFSREYRPHYCVTCGHAHGAAAAHAASN